jgi:hypothetical protein
LSSASLKDATTRSSSHHRNRSRTRTRRRRQARDVQILLRA